MKKIMFNEPLGLQQATLDERKNMTRRLVSNSILAKVEDYRREYYKQTLDSISVKEAIMNMVGQEKMFKAPYEVGEIVSIAQSYCNIEKEIDRLRLPFYLEDEIRNSAGYNNKMFVNPAYMVHHIMFTGFKVEYLQDISDEDCMREGIYKWRDAPDCPEGTKNLPFDLYGYGSWDAFKTPREAFAALIDKVSGKGTWENNPLVWVYEFKLID